MSETTFLGDAHHDRIWVSSLTGAQYRWNESWEVGALIGGQFAWRPYRAGVVTAQVYARSSEKFTEVGS